MTATQALKKISERPSDSRTQNAVQMYELASCCISFCESLLKCLLPQQTHFPSHSARTGTSLAATRHILCCRKRKLITSASLKKNLTPASQGAHNGCSVFQGFIRVLAPLALRDSLCRPVLRCSPCKRAGPVLAPPAIIQSIIDRVNACAFHALHHVPRAPAASSLSNATPSALPPFNATLARYSPSRALGVAGLLTSDRRFIECYGHGE
jgi:hypothetical protein